MTAQSWDERRAERKAADQERKDAHRKERENTADSG